MMNLKPQFREISLDKIMDFGDLRNRNFANGWQLEREIDALADSIRVVGLIEPIVVCPAGEKEKGKYEIIAGRRRFLAHKKLGKQSIAALVFPNAIDKQSAILLSVSENLVRRGLDFRELIDQWNHVFFLCEKHCGVKSAAKETGLPAAQIAFLMHKQPMDGACLLPHVSAHLKERVYDSLLDFAKSEGITEEEAVERFIESALSKKGFLKKPENQNGETLC